MDVRIFTEPQQGGSYDDLLRIAQATEAGGFDGFFRSDHYLRMGDGDPGVGPTDAWTTLAGLARETSRIRLGTLVTAATFRHPGPLAVSVAQVDAMSGGRIELGLGTGWFEAEHAAYGLDFPPLGERFDRFAEQLEVITGLWQTPVGERLSFTGDHYTVTDSPALPKPVQSPVPLIIGGAGKTRTPALAARFATEFNLPFASPEDLAAAYARVDAACEAIDRDPATMTRSVAVVVCCGRDDAEVARRAAVMGRDVDELRRNGLAGSPDEVVASLARWTDVGATRVYLQILDLHDVDHVDLIAESVLPQLQ